MYFVSKKASATGIKYGLETHSGALRHISEVPRGLSCDCICVKCGTALIANKGDVYDHHFRHEFNNECIYSSEISLYVAMKVHLENVRELTLPEIRFSIHGKPIYIAQKTISVQSVLYQKDDASYPPLLIVNPDGQEPIRILLCFHNPSSKHYIELRKELPTSYKTPCIVYFFPFANADYSPSFFLNEFNHPNHAQWCYNNSVENILAEYLKSFVTLPKDSAYVHCPRNHCRVVHSDCSECPLHIVVNGTEYCQSTNSNTQDFSDSHSSPFTQKQTSHPAVPSNQQIAIDNEETRNRFKMQLEQKRIQANFHPDSEQPHIDSLGRRWIKCKICQKIKQDNEMAQYGGSSANWGICSACARTTDFW